MPPLEASAGTAVGQLSLSGQEGPEPDGSVAAEVRAHWRRYHQTAPAAVSPKIAKLVKARLKEGCTRDDLLDAVDGCHAHPWNRGDGTGTRYLDLELILRDAAHVTRYAEHYREMGAAHGR